MESATDRIDDGFVPDITEELVRSGYSGAGWRRFWGRAWEHSWANIAARPVRRTSTIRWLIVCAVFFVAVVGAARPEWRHAPGVVGCALWAGAASFWVYLHQGLIRHTDTNVPFDGFLLANGLSYVRLANAPLLLLVMYRFEPGASGALLVPSLLAVLSATDLFDGIAARSRGELSRLGAIVDPMADIALMAWLAIGMWAADLMPWWAMALVMLRYPGAFVIGVVFYFAVGVVRVKSTLLGKVATFSTLWLMLAVSIFAYFDPDRLAAGWLAPLWVLVGGLLLGSFAWLAHLGLRERRRIRGREL